VGAELVTALEAFADEVRIGFGKSAGKEDRRFDAEAIATVQE
jgi:hypothetical protein